MIFGFLFAGIPALLVFLALIKYGEYHQAFNKWSRMNIGDLPQQLNIEIATTISIAIFAFFGFWALIWRTTVSTMQVRELEKQGRRTEKQLKLTAKQVEVATQQAKENENNNQLKILAEASALIAEDIESRKLTGITLLRYIGVNSTEWLRDDAIQLLRELARSGCPDGPVTDQVINKIKIFARSLEALQFIGEKYKIRIPLRIEINGNGKNIIKKFMYSIHMEYKCYKFLNCNFKEDNDIDIDNSDISIFISCIFCKCKITNSLNFKNKTEFNYCKIYGINYDLSSKLSDLSDKYSNLGKEKKYKFKGCDFSEFEGAFDFDNAEYEECYYIGDGVSLPEGLKKYLQLRAQ